MFAGPRVAILAIAGALVAAASVALLHVSVFAAVAAVNIVIAACWYFDARRAPAPTSFRITRELPTAVGIGNSLPITVRITNPNRARSRVWLRDSSVPSLSRSPSTHRATVEAQGFVDLASTGQPTRRGWLDLGPVTLRVAGPWGLGGRQSTIDVVSRIKVYPPLPGRRVVRERLNTARTLQSGMHSAAFHGGGTTFESLREYHPDDEFRRINWRATARARAAVTNIYREERDQQVVLVLDASRMMAGSIDGISRFEYAIDASHAVAELACRVGDQVGMVTFGSGIVSSVSARSGRQQSRSILDAMFDIEPSLDAPNFSGAFAGTLARHRRRSLLILLTELTDRASPASLLHAMPILVRKHLVVVGAIRDPYLDAAGRSTPSGIEATYTKAAAASLLVARQDAATALRAHGAQVEDRIPGEIAGALVDRYLGIKSAGRL